MQRITPFLWFNDNAEEAVNFYVSIFKNSKIRNIARYGEAGAKVSGRTAGSVMTIDFELDGQEFMALNGGPYFTFSEAISFHINCKSQQEVDDFWSKLSEGGQIQQCGWLKDRFGVTWQVVPTILGELLKDKDAKRVERVMQALLQMKKIDVETLERARG